MLVDESRCFLGTKVELKKEPNYGHNSLAIPFTIVKVDGLSSNYIHEMRAVEDGDFMKYSNWIKGLCEK